MATKHEINNTDPSTDLSCLLTVQDIMSMLGIGRRAATRLLMDRRCPTLPRAPRGPIYVTRAGWDNYMAALSQPED